MKSPAKSTRKIFNYSDNKHSLQHRVLSPKTPKRRPIFSDDKYGTNKKQIIYKGNLQAQLNKDTACFLHKMYEKVDDKANLVKQLQNQNNILKQQNAELQTQNKEILKRITICGGLQKLKQKNSQYRTKLLKAQSLLYQLRASSKRPIKGIDQLIHALHI